MGSPIPRPAGHCKRRPHRRAIQNIRLIAIVLGLSAITAACQTSGPSISGSGPPAMNATIAQLLPRSVQALPSFDFAAYEHLLYQLRGVPVIVNLWASWCGPCRTEMPTLVQAAKRYGHDVQFLGVDFQDRRGTATMFLRHDAVPYPSVFDSSGEIHNKLGFVGLPDTVFYGTDGKIVATWPGPLTTGVLNKNLQRLVSA